MQVPPDPVRLDPAAVILASLRFLRNEWLPLLAAALPLVALKTWLAWDIEQAWAATMAEVQAQAPADGPAGPPTLTPEQANTLGSTVGPRFLQLLLADAGLLAVVLAYLKRRTDTGRSDPLAAWGLGLGLFPAVLVTRMLTVLAAFLGALAFLVPGLILWVRLALALPIVALERCTPFTAIGRSALRTGPVFWPLLTVMAALVSVIWAATQMVNLAWLEGYIGAGAALGLRIALEALDLVFVIALFRVAMLVAPPPAEPPAGPDAT